MVNVGISGRSQAATAKADIETMVCGAWGGSGGVEGMRSNAKADECAVGRRVGLEAKGRGSKARSVARMGDECARSSNARMFNSMVQGMGDKIKKIRR